MASTAKAAVDAVQDGVNKLGLKEGTVLPEQFDLIALVYEL